MKNYKGRYKSIIKSNWFKKAYADKSIDTFEHSNDLKNIKDLTETEAKEILKYVYKDKDKYDYEHYFTEIHQEPIIDENGNEQITFGGRSIIGIGFHNGQDNCILHFTNTKVLSWLYQHGYDIEDLLKYNEYLSDLEKDNEHMGWCLLQFARGEIIFKEGYKQNYTLDWVVKEAKECLQKYYFKDIDVEMYVNDLNKKYDDK